MQVQLRSKMPHWPNISRRYVTYLLNIFSNAQCSEWVSKPKIFWDGFFDFNVAFLMYIMTMSSQKLLICHENIVKMVLNPVHLEHFS